MSAPIAARAITTSSGSRSVRGVCDRCGGKEFLRRPDDKAEAVAVRLEAYRRQTAPILPYYQSRGLLRRVDGMGSPAAVAKEIDQILDGGLKGRAGRSGRREEKANRRVDGRAGFPIITRLGIALRPGRISASTSSPDTYTSFTRS